MYMGKTQCLGLLKTLFKALRNMELEKVYMTGSRALLRYVIPIPTMKLRTMRWKDVQSLGLYTCMASAPNPVTIAGRKQTVNTKLITTTDLIAFLNFLCSKICSCLFK